MISNPVGANHESPLGVAGRYKWPGFQPNFNAGDSGKWRVIGQGLPENAAGVFEISGSGIERVGSVGVV